jgi:hypothetical protein
MGRKRADKLQNMVEAAFGVPGAGLWESPGDVHMRLRQERDERRVEVHQSSLRRAYRRAEKAILAGEQWPPSGAGWSSLGDLEITCHVRNSYSRGGFAPFGDVCTSAMGPGPWSHLDCAQVSGALRRGATLMLVENVGPRAWVIMPKGLQFLAELEALRPS